MTFEQQLDIALEFLIKWNDGSFLWYKDATTYPEKINFRNRTDVKLNEDRLIPYLTLCGIENKFHLPIIYQLIHDGYIHAVWNPVNAQYEGQDPNQLKIAFNGIMFWNNGEGGYSKQKETKYSNDAKMVLQDNKAASDSQRLANGTMYLWIATASLVIVELLKWYFECTCHQ